MGAPKFLRCYLRLPGPRRRRSSPQRRNIWDSVLEIKHAVTSTRCVTAPVCLSFRMILRRRRSSTQSQGESDLMLDEGFR